VSLLCDALPRITSLRHLSLIGNRLSVEHVKSLIAAAAGLRGLHFDLRHNPAYPSAVPHLPAGWLLDLGPPYRPVQERESVTGAPDYVVQYCSITKMVEYQNKSFEELRYDSANMANMAAAL
jgi:hypothetical protein